MRISQALITNVVRQSADRATKALLDAQKPLLDQTSLAQPSQDLAKAGRVTLLDHFDRELARHDQSRATVRTDLASSEQALQSIGDLIVDAQDLALELGGDTVSDQVRKDGAATARALLDQIVGLVNRPGADGTYPFTGLAEGQPALAADLHYQGNDGVRRVEVAPGVSISATLSGRDVLGPNNELVTSLQDLISALDSGDSAAVRDTLTGIDEARTRVSGTLQQVGGRISTLDDLGDLTLSLRTSVQIEQGELTGIDIASLSPAVQSAQTMLEAVMTTSQNILAQIGKSWFQ